MSTQPPEPSLWNSPAASLIHERDLYCLRCGYNLRGLAGDPIRCPECAFDNPVGDVELPAPLIRARLRAMETMPALALLVFLAMCLATVLVFFNVFMRGFGGGVGEILMILVLLALAWSGLLARYRNSCMAKSGWLAALALYHIAGVACVLVIMVSMGLVLRIALLLMPARPAVLTLAGSLPLILAVPWLFRGVHARAVRRMHAVQREVAVQLARDDARRRILRKRRT